MLKLLSVVGPRPQVPEDIVRGVRAAADVDGWRGREAVVEGDVDEGAGRGEGGAVECGDGCCEVGKLGGGEWDGVVDFVEGHGGRVWMGRMG